MRTSKTYLGFLSVFTTYYMSLVVFSLFFPLFLEHHGFSRRSIGTILAVAPFVGFVAQPFWGALADRSRDKRRVLALLFVCAGSASLLFYLSDAYSLVLSVMVVFTFFHLGIEPISTAVTLEYSQKHGWAFGKIRMAGTIGYSVMAVVAGRIMNLSIEFVFGLFCLLSVLGAASTGAVPRVPGHREPGKRIRMREILADREIVLLLSFFGLVSTTLFFYFVFFPIYFTGLGARTGLLGWSTLISAAPEVLVLMVADRLIRRFGARKLMLASGAALGVRWLLTYVITNPYALLPVQLLHGVTFILMFVAVADTISRRVRPELKASGQALHSVVVAVAARIVGSMLGGLLSDSFGLRSMFLYNGIYVLVCVAAFAAIFAIDSARNSVSAS